MKKLQNSNIGGEKGVFLFLDFDGTLSPIAKNPNDAVLPFYIKKWLRELSRGKKVKIGIVTGRALPDIRRKVGLKNIIYAANHGMEIFHNGKHLLRMGHAYKKPLQMLACELRESLSDVSGVVVENKELSVAVHFRMVGVRSRVHVKKVVKKLSEFYLKKYKLQLTAGKMILEIRPAKIWNKGRAVLWVWRKLAPQYTPVYIGDDATDEDAFKALRPYDSVTIRIGMKRRTHAKCFVESIRDIMRSGMFD